MFAQRGLRLLPGRFPLMILGGVAFAVVVVILFADLAMTKSAAVANNQRARTKVEQLQTQNILLRHDLERAQNDQQIIPRGWDYFGKTPKGVQVVIAEPETPAVSPALEQAPASRTPFWVDLWQKIRRP